MHIEAVKKAVEQRIADVRRLSFEPLREVIDAVTAIALTDAEVVEVQQAIERVQSLEAASLAAAFEARLFQQKVAANSQVISLWSAVNALSIADYEGFMALQDEFDVQHKILERQKQKEFQFGNGSSSSSITKVYHFFDAASAEFDSRRNAALVAAKKALEAAFGDGDWISDVPEKAVHAAAAFAAQQTALRFVERFDAAFVEGLLLRLLKTRFVFLFGSGPFATPEWMLREAEGVVRHTLDVLPSAALSTLFCGRLATAYAKEVVLPQLATAMTAFLQACDWAALRAAVRNVLAFDAACGGRFADVFVAPLFRTVVSCEFWLEKEVDALFADELAAASGCGVRISSFAADVEAFVSAFVRSPLLTEHTLTYCVAYIDGLLAAEFAGDAFSPAALFALIDAITACFSLIAYEEAIVADSALSSLVSAFVERHQLFGVVQRLVTRVGEGPLTAALEAQADLTAVEEALPALEALCAAIAASSMRTAAEKRALLGFAFEEVDASIFRCVLLRIAWDTSFFRDTLQTTLDFVETAFERNEAYAAASTPVFGLLHSTVRLVLHLQQHPIYAAKNDLFALMTTFGFPSAVLSDENYVRLRRCVENLCRC